MATSKRTSYEQKPDQAANFRDSYQPSSRTQPKVRVGSAVRQPVIPTDMQEAVKLTGQWRHDGHRYHLFINHAGPHIEILLAFVENGISGKPKDNPRDLFRGATRVARLGGDASASDRTIYELYLHKPQSLLDTDLACGTLQHSHMGKRVTLSLDLGGISGNSALLPKLESIASSVALRYGQTPNLFENHVGQRSIPADVRSALWFPLTFKQVARLPGFILGARIQARSDNFLRNAGGPLQSFGYVDLIRAYFETAADPDLEPPQRNQRLANAADTLDALVLEAYSNALTLPAEQGGIDDFQEDFWRLASLESLHHELLTVAGQTKPRSLLDHTQHILDSPYEGVSMRRFVELLHLHPRKGGHYYKFDMELTDVDGSAGDAKKLGKILLKKLGKQAAKKLSEQMMRNIPVGALMGLGSIRKQDDPRDNPLADQQPPEWEGWYAIVLVGLKISASVAAGTNVVHSTGEARNVYGQAWLPEQLHGWAVQVDANGSMFGDGGGKSMGVSFLRCYGSGPGKPPVPLQFNLSGPNDVFGPAPGASVSFSRLSGMMHYLDSYVSPQDMEAPPEDQPFYVDVQGAIGPLHFPINEAGLTPDAEQLLNVFAATEVAILGMPGVTMKIDGYADQPDDDFPNMILSRNRAISTFNYLKNILGDDLAIPELEQPEDEKKEREDRKTAEGSKQDDQVFIPKSDHVTIIPHGEPKPLADEKNVKPEYNQDFRRVDLSVAGLISLRLRRTDDGLGR